MTRISDTFAKAKKERRAALVSYVMAYDPDLKTSFEIMLGLPKAGADVIELGVPFSDPMADGPTIQRAGLRALENGATLKKTLAMVNDFRKENKTTPVILMGYLNPILHYGIKNFVRDAENSGVDGFIIVDLPPEEEKEFTDISKPSGLSLVKLTAPTTDAARAKIVLKNASGFVYYVSVAGITGTKSAETSDIKEAVNMLKKHTKLPIAVGFGIKTPEQAAKIAKIADGVVVGSAFVNLIEKNLNNKKKAVSEVLGLACKISSSLK